MLRSAGQLARPAAPQPGVRLSPAPLDAVLPQPSPRRAGSAAGLSAGRAPAPVPVPAPGRQHPPGEGVGG